jgi:hypothetical protein
MSGSTFNNLVELVAGLLKFAPVMPYSVGTVSTLEHAPFRVDSVINFYRVLSPVERHGSDCAATCEQVDENCSACGKCWSGLKYIQSFWYGNPKQRDHLHIGVNL